MTIIRLCRVRMAAFFAWALRNEFREYLLWTAVSASFSTINLFLCVALILIYRPAVGALDLIIHALSGPFVLILLALGELREALSHFLPNIEVKDFILLLILMFLIVPGLTFAWLAALPSSVWLAYRARGRWVARKTSAAPAIRGPETSFRSIAPWLVVGALINAAIARHAAGKLQPEFLRPRTETFDWRFAVGWFLGTGLPFGFSPLCFMVARRLLSPPGRRRMAEFARRWFADYWRGYITLSVVVAVVPSLIYAAMGARPISSSQALHLSVVTLLTAPVEIFWGTLRADEVLLHWFENCGRYKEALATLTLVGAIGPIMTFAWLTMLPAIAWVGLSIWRFLLNPLQIGRRAGDQPRKSAALIWLAACATMNGVVLGVATLRTQFFTVDCDTFHCIDKWLEFAPLMLAYGAPYAFAPLLLMAAARHAMRA